MEAKKRIYLGLLAVSLGLVAVLGIFVWYLYSNYDYILSKIILTSLISVVALLLMIFGVGIVAMVIMVARSENIPSLENIAHMVNDTLFPLTILTGKILGISKEKIMRSYIAVNNNLVETKKLLFEGNQVMLLLPHCLQNSDCPYKITMDIGNCRRCGKCPVSDLIELGKRYNAIIKVATGGTLARKFIEEYQPRGVVAVACERDLSMGIHDSGYLPVIGVLNDRPHGPCFNTGVDLNMVQTALDNICKGG